MALAQPEVTLPVQFFAALRHHPRSLSELRLLGAIVEDAVHCFQEYLRPRTPRQHRLFRDAEQWIMHSWATQPALHDETGFSFEDICAVLDLNPAYVRGGLQRWRQRQLAPASTALRVSASTLPVTAVYSTRRLGTRLPGATVL